MTMASFNLLVVHELAAVADVPDDPAAAVVAGLRQPSGPGVIIATSVDPSIAGPCRTAAALAVLNKVST